MTQQVATLNGPARRGELLWLMVLAVINAPLMTASVAAQDTAPKTPVAVPSLSPTSVQGLLKSLEDSKLDDATRAKATNLYQKALEEHLAAAKDHEAKAAEYQHQIDTAEADLNKVKAERDALPPIGEVKVADDSTLEHLEERLKNATAELQKTKAAAEKLDAEPNRRRRRENEIPPLQASATESVKRLQQQLKMPAPDGEAPELTTARKTQLRSELREKESELARFAKELEAYSATAELLRAQRDLAAGKAARAETEFSQLVSLVGERKKKQAADEARRIRMQVANANPSLKSLAEENLKLAEEGEQLVGQLEQLGGEVLQTAKDLDSLQNTAKDSRSKVERIGPTEAMGLLLRKHRERLPRSEDYRRRIRERREEIQTAQSRLMDLDQMRSDLAVMGRKVDSTIADLPAKPANMSATELRLTVRELLEQRRDLLDALIASQDRHFESLVALTNVEQEFASELDEYRAYIDERILWIRSTDAIHWSDFTNSMAAISWVLSPANWSEVASLFGNDVKSSPVVYALSFALLLVALAIRPRLGRRLDKMGDAAASDECVKYRPTLVAFVITLLLALFWAALPYFLSWRLTLIDSSDEFVFGLRTCLGNLAEVLFATGLLVCVCRPKGLGASHFRWSEKARQILRTRVGCFVAVVIPVGLISSLCMNQSNPTFRNSLGRMCFVMVLASLGIFTHFTLKKLQKPRSGTPGPRRINFAYSTPMMWYLVGAIIPMVLAIMAAAGFLFTTTVLAHSLRDTVIVMLEITILGAMLQRWFLLSRRRIAARQAAAEEQPAEQAKDSQDDSSAKATAKAPSVDLQMLERQSRQLLKVVILAVVVFSLWHIWHGALPALGALDEVKLWEVGSGADAKETTLRHLGMALVVMVVTVIAVRDLPGMLELLLLNRLPFDFGARYALMTVVRYGLLILGFVAAFNALGIQWSQYQWLVAAATVGLGFGLQEIFANFVSGLILLAERPIRVGDVVTVGDVTGTVSKISMRSTIVTNWDRQEFIVPNKDFVTGKVLNWTLSNSINRIVIHVPVSPESDPSHVRESLLKVAREHPLLTDDPGPIVTFDQFTDGTLRFTLRCYLPNMDNRLGTIHELHEAIHRTLLEEGIDVAAPRHNIYISTAEESDVLGTREKRQLETE